MHRNHPVYIQTLKNEVFKKRYSTTKRTKKLKNKQVETEIPCQNLKTRNRENPLRTSNSEILQGTCLGLQGRNPSLFCLQESNF